MGKVRLFGMAIDNLGMEAAVAEIERLLPLQRPSLVVTPNVQHVHLFRKDKEFSEVYRQANLVLADSTPLVWASRICGQPLKERVAGADLLPAFCALAAKRKYRLFFLGARPGVAREAAARLAQRHPGLEVVGIYSPALGFEQDDRQNELVVDLINRARPDVLCLGLGTPKQEKWAGRFRHRLNVSAILCVGAAFDFASRKARRAPRVIQRAGLEWAFRLIREPRRLWKRYLIGNLSFMFLVIEELRKRKRGRDRGAPKEP